MKKGTKQQHPQDSLERYDASKATRGRHAGELATGTPWRRLEDDLAKAFPTSSEVNRALRAVLEARKLLEDALEEDDGIELPKVVVKVGAV